MLAKVIRNHPLKFGPRHSFQTRIDYGCGKARVTETINLAGYLFNASDQMQFCAGLNERLRTPACHIVITWSETETPTDAEMIAAVKMVLKDFGAEGHQAVLAVHRDRPSPHVHTILNRVHPVTGTTLSLSNDYARLERACRRVEHHMCWPADRGRFDIDIVDGEVELRPKPPEHWERKTKERAHGIRPDGKSVHAHQLRANKGFLRDALSDTILSEARSILDNAKSWKTIQKRLAKIDLEYLRVRSGARIRQISTGLFMAASQLGSRFAWGKMKARLGSKLLFIENSSAKINTRITEAPTKLKKLKDRQEGEQLAVRKTLNGARSPEAQALRAVMQEVHTKQREQLKDTQDGAHTPLPHPEPNPPNKVSERYRHALRRRTQDMPILDDHTTRRQDWMLLQHIDNPDVNRTMTNLAKSWPHAIRTDGKGGLLFAKRDLKDNVLSFERVSLSATVEKDPTASSHKGLCIFGHPEAKTCIVARTARDAVRQLVGSADTESFVIITGADLDTETAKHLQQVLKGRENVLLVASDARVADYLDTLSTVLPKTKLIPADPEPNNMPDADQDKDNAEPDEDEHSPW